MKLESFLAWQPNVFSEDHVTNFLARVLVAPEWRRVYYNPPSGSWKTVSLYSQNYEYRQLGPKRGVSHIKRPDLAVQDMTEDQRINLFLAEAKTDRLDWDPRLPELMKAYFEGAEDGSALGLRGLPFFHRRIIGNSTWERLTVDSEERCWFRSARTEYAYCFAYSVGFIGDDWALQTHYGWMDDTATQIDNKFPTVFVAIGWRDDGSGPRVAVSSTQSHKSPVARNAVKAFAPFTVERPL